MFGKCETELYTMSIEQQFKNFIRLHTAISDREFEESMACFQKMTLTKGAFLVQQGQVCRQIAFVGSGVLRTYYLNEKGEDTTSCFCTPNHFTTAYKSFILQIPSNISIEALETSEILMISHHNLQKLYANSAAWLNIGRVFIEREYLQMEQYATVLNNETAKEKYQRMLTEQPEIIQSVPVHFIASYLGVTRRTLSRIRKAMTDGI